ncbi:Phosphoribosylformylglycinamidine synthase, glutamine amidotransferase subunit [hydrothermal vent metagenome]|uniref:Phosphoribosylformylglycinamidine synthase, glutamine amidotransferase subunit n=1 Tax=hydrothermal vent metagenome TaxID=652676 RepID=A0A3B0RU10_9ZZZZ
MRAAIIVFPGSNCDRDAARAIEQVTGHKPYMVWHRETELRSVDLVVLPGGFAYGDYLRAGAMAARSSIMQEICAHAKRGGLVAGICNGFQVLTEAGLLPGVLMRNAGLKFICKPVELQVCQDDTAFTRAYSDATKISIPIAHHDGNFRADADTLSRMEDAGQVVFRYVDNPNGSANDIAGIINPAGNVLGMMPHPERAIGTGEDNADGLLFFKSLVEASG